MSDFECLIGIDGDSFEVRALDSTPTDVRTFVSLPTGGNHNHNTIITVALVGETYHILKLSSFLARMSCAEASKAVYDCITNEHIQFKVSAVVFESNITPIIPETYHVNIYGEENRGITIPSKMIVPYRVVLDDRMSDDEAVSFRRAFERAHYVLRKDHRGLAKFRADTDIAWLVHMLFAKHSECWHGNKPLGSDIGIH